MTQNIPTLMVTIIAASAVLAVSIAAVAFQRSRVLSIWAWALGVHTLAFVLFALRGQVSDTWSIVAGNTALATAFSLFAEGFFDFHQRRQPRWLTWLPVPVVAIGFTYWIDNVAARSILGAVVIASQCLFILAALIGQRRNTAGRGQYMLMIGYVLVVVVIGYRIVEAVSGSAEVVNGLVTSPANAATLLVSLAGLMLLATGMPLMTQERAENELSDSRALLKQQNIVLQDYSERMEAANRVLAQSEARYRSVVNASPDDITITDPEGRIVMVSPVALQLFGYAELNQFIGRPVTDFIVPEDRVRALAQVALRRQGVMTGASEYRGLRLDGTIFDIEVNSEFMRDAEGAPTGLVVIVRDITARKQAEAEKERLEAMNRQLQKSESLGRMAGAIAHHFNNQLQAVMMSLEVAMVDLPAQAAGVENLTDAMTSARRAAEVSSQMLTYLGQSHSQRERQDLSVTCEQYLPLLRVVLPQGTALETALPSPGPVVCANANQIQQVLNNLVTNAVEAQAVGHGEAHLAVTTTRAADVPPTNRFPIDWQPRQQTYACIEVTDAGSGIAAGDIEQLFDPFFSSKFTGRGLGLPVVLGIARAHGGAVHVENRPGRTVFRVYLPVADAAGDE